MLFRGAFVAIVTPFDRKGRVDGKTLRRLVEWQIQEGTDGILCCGATGEGIALTEAEKKKVASICLEVAGGRIPIIVASGLAGTKQSVELTEKMQKLGVQGTLVVTPYYNRPSERGCILHFQEVAKVGLPIIPYYNPGRAPARITPEGVAKISEIPGVVAWKDSSGSIEFIRKVRQLCSIPILSGDDDLTFPTIQEGGVGAISVMGNVFPKLWKKMIDLALQGKWNESKIIFDRLMPLCKAHFRETNPQGVKYSMKYLGLINGFLRLPLVAVTEETENEIEQAIVALGLPQWERVKVPR